MTKKNYVLTSTLQMIHGGRTKALLERTRQLEKELNEKFTMVTTNYNPNYNEVYNHYIENKYVSPNTKFINIYDYLANRDYNYRNKIIHSPKLEGYQIQEAKKNTIYRYYVNGEYQRYRKYNKDTGALLFEDIMDPYSRKRKERLEYNNFGFCFRKKMYKIGTTIKITELYYDDEGKIYLEKWFKGENETVSRILLFGEDILEFKTEEQFFEYMFNQILEDDSRTLCDARLLDESLIKSKVNTEKIFVLHSSHYKDNNLRASYDYLFNHSDEADKIVVLTDEQAKDIIDFGIKKEKIEVIPHSIDESKIDHQVKRAEISKEILFIGRLEQEKQIDHVICAFNLIHKEFSDWTLSIYGKGKEEEKLQELIHEHELNDKVQLEGYANHVSKLYEQAAFSVVASKYEGFGLVIMESIHKGCPVLTYDFKYGPKDIIQNNENGLIVEHNNIESLANGMKEMILNPLTDVQLNRQFYSDQTIEKWKHMFNK